MLQGQEDRDGGSKIPHPRKSGIVDAMSKVGKQQKT